MASAEDWALLLERLDTLDFLSKPLEGPGHQPLYLPLVARIRDSLNITSQGRVWACYCSQSLDNQSHSWVSACPQEAISSACQMTGGQQQALPFPSRYLKCLAEGGRRCRAMRDHAHRFAPGILLRSPGTNPCSNSTNSRVLEYQGARETPFPKLDLEASLKSHRAGNGHTKFQALLPRAMQCKLALGESLSPLSGGVSGSFLGYGT